VIDRLKQWSPRTTVVGFKLLSGRTFSVLKRQARRLAERSGADAVVANDWREVRTGRHRAYLITPQGVKRAFGKKVIAEVIVNYLEGRHGQR
jgi:phosphopantothenoylcysteine synthetase/decarboxylase